MCYFVVFTLKTFKIMRVEKNEEFGQNMIVTLDAFFHEYLRKAVLRRFLYRDYYSYNFQPLRLLPEHIEVFKPEKAIMCPPLQPTTL